MISDRQVAEAVKSLWITLWTAVLAFAQGADTAEISGAV